MGLLKLFKSTNQDTAYKWGLSLLEGKEANQLLLLGSDEGRNLLTLLETYPSAHITCVESTSKDVTQKERYEIIQDNIADLSLPTKSNDLAFSFDSIYFWPDIDKCFREIYRVLVKNGSFVIINESDGKDLSGRSYQRLVQNMKVYTSDEIVKFFKKAGFKNIQTYHHETHPWITIIGQKG